MKESMFGDQDYNLWWLTIQMRRAMHKARAKELSQYGITPEESGALFAIKAIGSRATPAKIARWELREHHTTSALLVRMEKKGLVKRTRNLERKNMIRVTLTKRGREVYNHAAKRESIHRILSCIPKDQREQLWSLLQRLRDKSLEELNRSSKLVFPPAP